MMRNRYRGDELQGGRLRDRRAPDVRIDLHPVRLRQRDTESLRFALPLDAIEAGRVRLHARAKGTAQQSVDGQLMKFAGQVPERDNYP